MREWVELFDELRPSFQQFLLCSIYHLSVYRVPTGNFFFCMQCEVEVHTVFKKSGKVILHV